MLCRLRCLSGFPVSCGDELILSTSLLPADRALTMKCWLAQFHFACVMLVSQSLWDQKPCSFCRTGFCVYLQWAVVGLAGRSDLGSQDGGQETKIFSLFHREFKAESGEEQPSLGTLLEALAMTLRLLWTLVAAQEASVVLLGGGLWLLPCLETSGKWDLIVWTAQVTFETTVYCHLLWCYFCIVSTQVPKLLTWGENLCVGLAGSSGSMWNWRWCPVKEGKGTISGCHL